MSSVSTDVMPTDVLVVGGGPAALAIAAELAEQGLAVAVLSASDWRDPWPNTYGIWGDEVDALGLGHLLEHRWSYTCSYFGSGSSDPADPANSPTRHGRDYGLFDKTRLQQFWLERCEAAGVQWIRGLAEELIHGSGRSQVRYAPALAADVALIEARLVVDASGHKAVFVQRPELGPVAGQAAYGVVGRFTAPPVQPGQFVLMDYRADHLSEAERQEPPLFSMRWIWARDGFLWRRPPWPWRRLCPTPRSSSASSGGWPIAVWRSSRWSTRSFACFR